MSPGSRQTAVSSIPRSTEVIVDFSPEKLKAPFLLRCGALLADYIILISVPVAGLVVGKLFGDGGAKPLGIELNNAIWLILLLFGLTNFIILPIYCGQTIGKMLTGLRIVKNDGTAVTPGSMVFRQIFGYGLTLASLGIGFLISVLSSKGRALHDYVAGTVVIYADKRIR